jgi:hypothetical protein
MVQRLERGPSQIREISRTGPNTSGKHSARQIAHRHRLLTDFLKLLGLTIACIYHDVEGMEHHISLPTLRAHRSIHRINCAAAPPALSCKPRSFSKPVNQLATRPTLGVCAPQRRSILKVKLFHAAAISL